MSTAEILDHKTPPQNLEMEESILAACILSDEMRQDALTYMLSQDFYSGQNRLVFETIARMEYENLPADLASVVDKLRSTGHLEKAGGAARIAKLLDYAPVPPNVCVYTDRLKRYARLRQIINICGSTLQKAMQGRADDLEDLLSEFQGKALAVGEGLSETWVAKRDLTNESIERYQELNEGSAYKSLPTGFPTLDKMTGGGFRGPKLIIVAARPRVGKTALMCNMVQNMSRRGISCGVFSLEMDKTELDDRWIAAGSGVNSMKLTSEPGPDTDEWKRILSAADRQSNWKTIVDDNPADIADLKRRIRQMVKAGAEIIFIDQLSSIPGNRKKDTWERNSEHVEELKFLKKELRIPIVLLAQLNRELEKRNSKKPILSDLKNTGQLEEDADIVLMGHRPYLYPDANGKRDNSLRDYGEWEITKNRQGAEWNLRMKWFEKYQLFQEIAVEYE
ncbi:MAG: AAA family ATPase [Desulfobacterales bacterium]|nr:AAA family ATPase [Desulfobacterales bacterium]